MLLSPQLGAGPSARATVCVGRGVRVCERGKEASRKVYGRLNLPPWGAEGSGASLGEELCLFGEEVFSGSALRSTARDATGKSFLPRRWTSTGACSWPLPRDPSREERGAL